MDKPSVSIIVPVYNVEPYVEDCIRSVMRQTYNDPMECIVVDDCGTDNSMAVVERLIAEYKGPITFKVLHHDHNRGLSAARNTGMDAAKGDYLFFLDSDDELIDDCIERFSEPLATEWYDIIVGNLEKRSNGAVTRDWALKLADKTVLRSSEIIDTYRSDWKMMAQNKLYRTSFIRDNDIRFKEGLIHEDELWSFQVACLANSLYAVNKITYYYIIRPGGIMSQRSQESQSKAFALIVKEMGAFVKNRGVIYRNSINELIQSFFLGVLRYYSYSFDSFSKMYMDIRPFIKFSFTEIIKSDLSSFKHLIRDFHFFLPSRFAIYWEWMLFLCIKNRNR